MKNGNFNKLLYLHEVMYMNKIIVRKEKLKFGLSL